MFSGVKLSMGSFVLFCVNGMCLSMCSSFFQEISTVKNGAFRKALRIALRNEEDSESASEREATDFNPKQLEAIRKHVAAEEGFSSGEHEGGE